MADSTFHDPFGRTHLPTGHLDSAARVRLLLAAADAMSAGKPVPADAAKFLSVALQTWLRAGGDLDRCLGLRAPQGSHLTASAFAHRIRTFEGTAGPSSASSEVRRFEASSGRAQADLFDDTIDE